MPQNLLISAIMKKKLNGNIKIENDAFVFTEPEPNSYLPKPGQDAPQQNCTVHQYGHKLMNKTEVAESKEKSAFNTSCKNPSLYMSNTASI